MLYTYMLNCFGVVDLRRLKRASLNTSSTKDLHLHSAAKLNLGFHWFLSNLAGCLQTNTLCVMLHAIFLVETLRSKLAHIIVLGGQCTWFWWHHWSICLAPNSTLHSGRQLYWYQGSLPDKICFALNVTEQLQDSDQFWCVSVYAA